MKLEFRSRHGSSPAICSSRGHHPILRCFDTVGKKPNNPQLGRSKQRTSSKATLQKFRSRFGLLFSSEVQAELPVKNFSMPTPRECSQPVPVDDGPEAVSNLPSLDRLSRNRSPPLTGPFLVTIGITCFNARDTIGRAIASAQAQDWPAIEIVVVDDRSSDGSPDAVRALAECDHRIRLIVHERNGGTAVARNTVLANANGEFIAFFR